MTRYLKQSCLLVLTIFTLLLLAPCASGQESQSEKPLQLERIEFEGLKRYSREQMIEASGLKIGQPVNETILDEAASRLMQTGFFKNMGYRVRAATTQATVTFQVEEVSDKGVLVVFDNFVWFTDEELATAIRREIPSFDGTTLEIGNTNETIKAILQRLLQEKKISGQVEHLPSSDPSGGGATHVFTIKGIKIPICEVTFTGANAIEEKELKENSKSLFNEDYSRGIVVDFANLSLGELYRERGYLRARFRETPIKTLNGSACKNGVAVTLAVEEGLQYTWDRAEWIDTKAVAARELSAALGMKAGEVASSTKLKKGLYEVQQAFGKKGYIMASVISQPEFDDANKRVAYRMTVKEGEQFKMGAFSITGLPADLSQRLTDKWELQQGEVYNASYLRTFQDAIMTSPEARDIVQRLGKAPEVKSFVKPDSKNLTVDVSINFK